MTDLERDLGRRWFEEVWNKGRREAIAEMLIPGAVIHDGGTDTAGAEGFYPFYDRLRGAFSEIHVEVQDSFAEGDKICVRWSCTGKHTGDGLGIAPSGAMVHVTGISILRVADGKLVEGWQNWDMLGLMEQISGHPRSATYIAQEGLHYPTAGTGAGLSLGHLLRVFPAKPETMDGSSGISNKCCGSFPI